MKAFLLHSYGAPGNLQLTEVDKPVPGAGEVLVRVRATSINPYDWHHMRGEPVAARFMSGGPGKRKPRHTILGCDIAGEVEAAGPGVTRFQPGDEVFALIKTGGFGQYVCVPEDHLAPKPANLSFEQAAAVPMAAATALLAVRDDARVEPGQRVLINGASGGVGTFAVQLARALGAEVTGVCSVRNVDLVKSLGATEVVDYGSQDFTRTLRDFDVLVDIAGSPAAWAARRVLRPKGTYVVVGGKAGRWFRPIDHVISVLAVGAVVSQRAVVTSVAIGPASAQNLLDLTPYLKSGSVMPAIDRSYPFEDLPEAMRYNEAGHVSGKVVVTIA